ncbi:HORMA domain-containing protein [Aspergillus ambiguus]|uniref:putative meiosis specific protein Hop1 n=1 Tax=Aspergillus ambiguus TaxID=176160 RepID=UPI003CCE1F78
MVRIKFTGPAAVQLHSMQAQQIAPKNAPSVRAKPRTELQRPTRLASQESVSLKQQLSLEMVQIMLHVSFGTLFYLREFLPLPCFDDRDLKEAQRGRKLSYRDFINKQFHATGLKRNPEASFGSGRRGQPLKIIVRGVDPKADMILDALETGIFDALRRKVLDAIQLTILVDKDVPENVLESYTFSFKYTGAAGDMDTHLESMTIDPVGCTADMKTAQTARVGLETIVRRLITLSAFLPVLPNKRNLGIHLFYTEDCPPDYQPPGFSAANNETIKYPLDDNWKKETQSCGIMDSGWHTVGLKVTSLKWTGPELEGSEAPPKIPAQLEYHDTVRRADDIGFSDGIQTLHCAEPRYSTVTAGGVPLNRNKPAESFEVTSQDLRDLEKLKNILAPESVNSDLVPTQPLTQPMNNDMTLKDLHIEGLKAGERYILEESKAAEIRERLCSQNMMTPDMAGFQSSSAINCQCGWNGPEAAMIECAFCYTRQHLLCYGFKNATDPKLPNVHACYQCLLEPNEPRLLSEMHTLALLRRALKIIVNEGYPMKTALFTQKLHCNGQTTVQITDLLKKRNFIQPTPGYKAKGFVRKGLPKFGLVSSGDVYSRMDREIFEPMLNIYHHYTRQASGSAPERSKLGIGYEHGSWGRPNEKVEDSQTLTDYGLQTPVDLESRKRKKPLRDTATESRQLNDLNRSLEGSPAVGSRASNEWTPTPADVDQSDNKRRKISNYPDPIDVGAETTDNESMCV